MAAPSSFSLAEAAAAVAAVAGALALPQGAALGAGATPTGVL